MKFLMADGCIKDLNERQNCRDIGNDFLPLANVVSCNSCTISSVGPAKEYANTIKYNAFIIKLLLFFKLKGFQK